MKVVSPSSGQSTNKLEAEIYQQDGDYIKDIEVNDLRNRYTLTKGSTQKMVNILIAIADTPRLLFIPALVWIKAYHA